MSKEKNESSLEEAFVSIFTPEQDNRLLQRVNRDIFNRLLGCIYMTHNEVKLRTMSYVIEGVDPSLTYTGDLSTRFIVSNIQMSLSRNDGRPKMNLYESNVSMIYQVGTISMLGSIMLVKIGFERKLRDINLLIKANTDGKDYSETISNLNKVIKILDWSSNTTLEAITEDINRSKYRETKSDDLIKDFTQRLYCLLENIDMVSLSNIAISCGVTMYPSAINNPGNQFVRPGDRNSPFDQHFTRPLY